MSNQRDVAKTAGLSSASVSRYINNPESVSEKTAARIQQAIDELGYRVDYSAQTLRTGVFHRVGIISASYGPFYWEILSAIEEVLAKSGYYINIYFTRKLGTLNDYHVFNMNMINNKQVDGFIVFPLLTETDDMIIRNLQRMNENFVVIDRNLEQEDVCQVILDNYEAGRDAARTLLERGHRQFLFVWGLQDLYSAQRRYQGFRDELARHNIMLTKDREVQGYFDAQSTYTAILEKYAHLPEFDAVFASNDFSAIGLMKALREKGKETPRDYSIIGFDNTHAAPFITTPLASFSQPLTQLGHLAAEMLLEMIQGNPIEKRRIILKPELIIRESVRESS